MRSTILIGAGQSKMNKIDWESTAPALYLILLNQISRPPPQNQIWISICMGVEWSQTVSHGFIFQPKHLNWYVPQSYFCTFVSTYNCTDQNTNGARAVIQRLEGFYMYEVLGFIRFLLLLKKNMIKCPAWTPFQWSSTIVETNTCATVENGDFFLGWHFQKWLFT